jgi:CMP-N,N'-diacetyllegionaminic acid synthase
MTIVAFIFARGGSKGLPEKNIRLLGGKPLIAWSIDHAISAKCIERVIV